MGVLKYKLSKFGATKRLSSLTDDLLEPLLFKEKLYVFDENGRRIGRFSLYINQDVESNESPKTLHVHISNRAFIDGKLSESLVTGTITSKLKTLQEFYYEGTDVTTSGKQERCMFLLREKTKYYLSVTNSVCGAKSQARTTIPFVEAIGMTGQSANAMLLRILAYKGYEGIICLKTLLPNGKRCRNYYVTKLSKQIINGQKMQVLIVYRNITNHRKRNITMTMALSRAGQLLYLFWSNSKCFLHVDPDSMIYTNRFIFSEPKLERHWHKDVQLHSLYLDRVDFQKMKCRSYKHQQEPLKRILGDFLEYLILMKPEDTICFAIEYFSAFGDKPNLKCQTFKPCKLMQRSDSFLDEGIEFSSHTASSYYGEYDFRNINFFQDFSSTDIE